MSFKQIVHAYVEALMFTLEGPGPEPFLERPSVCSTTGALIDNTVTEHLDAGVLLTVSIPHVKFWSHNHMVSETQGELRTPLVLLVLILVDYLAWSVRNRLSSLHISLI